MFEKCLIRELEKSDLNMEEFVHDRLEVCMRPSKKYFLITPTMLMFDDYEHKMIVIDIIINSRRARRVNPSFIADLVKDVSECGKYRRIGDYGQAKEDIQRKIKDLMKIYYPSVEVIRVDIASL